MNIIGQNFIAPFVKLVTPPGLVTDYVSQEKKVLLSEPSRPALRDKLTISQEAKVAYAQRASQPQEVVQSNAVKQVEAADRIFSTESGSVDNLIRFLGIDTINGNAPTLGGSLDLKLESEKTTLAEQFNKVLKEAGLDSEDIEFTLAVGKEGNIVVKGEIGDDKKEILAETIYSAPELLERIKDMLALLEIRRGIEEDLDLSSGQFASARHQLLKSFLKREADISLYRNGA